MFESIVEPLRRDILIGTFLPGERLVERELAERYDAGRAGVRTALALLHDARLVGLLRHHGARVRVVAVDEAVELLGALGALERMMLPHARGAATERERFRLRRMLASCAKLAADGSLAAVMDQQDELQRQVWSLAGTPIIGDEARRLDARLLLFWRRADARMAPYVARAQHLRSLVEAVSAPDDAAGLSLHRLSMMRLRMAIQGARSATAGFAQ